MFYQIIDNYIDLTIQSIGDGKVTAKVLTELPEDFYFKTGTSVEILEEEILYRVANGTVPRSIFRKIGKELYVHLEDFKCWTSADKKTPP